MKIIVELDIPDNQARLLRSWASVGRYFDSVRRLTEKICIGETVLEPLESESVAVEEDAAMLKQPLDTIHRQIRNALVKEGVEPLWDQNGR